MHHVPEQRSEVADDAPILALPVEPAIPPPGAAQLDVALDVPFPRPEHEQSGKRVWSVGTLTYTSGTLITLFAFLLGGDFALSMRDRAISPIVQLMLKHFGASDTTMALLLATLPPMLTLLFAPVISFKSDRLRSSWGRRIPFLLVTTPIAAGSMVAIAFSEDLGRFVASTLLHSAGRTDDCAIAFFGVFWTVFECAAVTAAAVMGGLVNDVVPRAVLGRFFALFRAVSLGAGIVFNYWAMAYAGDHSRLILSGIAGLFLVGFLLMCFTVREGQYAAPDLSEANSLTTGRRLASVKLYFRESFRDPYYRWVFAAITFAAVAMMPVNLFSLLYSAQLQVSNRAYGRLIALTYCISLLMAWPMGWLVDRLSALKVATACMAIYTIAMLAAGLSIHGAVTFGIALVAFGVLSGAYFTGSASLGQALFPRTKFAQFASAAGIVQALVTMAVSPTLGRVLDFTGHNYRITFYAGSGIGAIACVCLLIVCNSTSPVKDGIENHVI